MSHPLKVAVRAPFAVGNLIARVDLENGASQKILLRNGMCDEVTPSRARRMTLTFELPPPDFDPQKAASLDQPDVPEGDFYEIDQLLEGGVDVPQDGNLKIQLLWAAHCHSEPMPGLPEGKRFGSREHIACADYVGKAAVTPNKGPKGAPKLTLRSGAPAWFDFETPLLVGDYANTLTFGEIVCLAGDYYAHLDALAATEFAPAWPVFKGIANWLEGDYRDEYMSTDKAENFGNLLEIIRSEKQGWMGEYAHLKGSIRGKFPARRYLALAATNSCHFVSPGPPGQLPAPDFALWLYREYHRRALAHAGTAGAGNPKERLIEALAIDAFGCHFLTDHFAGGHIRVPRRLLAERYGVLRGSLMMSLKMHNEENAAGLWCCTRASLNERAKTVWRAYGDGKLLSSEGAHNLMQVQEAVRRSAAEIYAASVNVSLADADKAEAMLPVPLPPGVRPGPNDVLPGRLPLPAALEPNTYPLYWFDIAGRILVRDSDSFRDSYSYQDSGEAKEAPTPMPFEV